MSSELVRIQDIAMRLGVVPSAVSNWRKRFDNFPTAQYADAHGRGGLFVWSEVDAWYQAFTRGYMMVSLAERLEPYRVTRVAS